MNAAELKEAFKLTYHIDCLERAARAGHLRGARVLEVGGALPRDVVMGHYGAAAWTAVDNRSAYSSVLGGTRVGARTEVLDARSLPAAEGGYVSYDGDASSLPPSFAGAYDVVFSLATFEHIADLGAALRHIGAALRPGGLLLAQVGPIWSGWRGHHVFPGHLGSDADKTDDLLDHMVPWQHLIMQPGDMQAWLTTRYGAAYAENAVGWIYESPRLNRLFYEDYVELFAAAGLRTTAALQPNGARVPAGWDRTLLGLVKTLHRANSAFEVDSFWVTLEKPVPVGDA
jgi:SAM-dependent methyltransferase